VVKHLVYLVAEVNRIDVVTLQVRVHDHLKFKVSVQKE
jgi:hypothetical protein